jgi:hypothetical protein
MYYQQMKEIKQRQLFTMVDEEEKRRKELLKPPNVGPSGSRKVTAKDCFVNEFGVDTRPGPFQAWLTKPRSSPAEVTTSSDSSGDEGSAPSRPGKPKRRVVERSPKPSNTGRKSAREYFIQPFNTVIHRLEVSSIHCRTE